MGGRMEDRPVVAEPFPKGGRERAGVCGDHFRVRIRQIHRLLVGGKNAKDTVMAHSVHLDLRREYRRPRHPPRHLPAPRRAGPRCHHDRRDRDEDRSPQTAVRSIGFRRLGIGRDSPGCRAGTCDSRWWEAGSEKRVIISLIACARFLSGACFYYTLSAYRWSLSIRYAPTVLPLISLWLLVSLTLLLVVTIFMHLWLRVPYVPTPRRV